MVYTVTIQDSDIQELRQGIVKGISENQNLESIIAGIDSHISMLVKKEIYKDFFKSMMGCLESEKEKQENRKLRR